MGALGGLGAVGGCASGWGQPAASQAAAERAVAQAALRQLFDDTDEADLRRRPIEALARGDLRFADQHGDWLSAEAVADEAAAARGALAQLARIPRQPLDSLNQLAYDSFARQQRLALQAASPPLDAVWPRLPINPFDCWPLYFAQLSSGADVAPYRSVQDFDQGLARLAGFERYLQQVIQRCREGMALGVVQPRVVVALLLRQLDGLIDLPLARSPFMQPLGLMPPQWPTAQRQRLRDAYAATVGGPLRQGLQQLRDFLAGPYLAQARDSVGLWDVPGGVAWYRHLVLRHAGGRLSAEEIHQVGRSEVARIREAMNQVRRDLGFSGSLAEFFAHVRQDPANRPRDEAALLAAYEAVNAQVAQALPRLFNRLPSTPLDIRALPAYLAPGAASAHYQSGSAAQGRPGVFHVNTSELASRPLNSVQTLYLHEAVPGHHFQSSLVDESPGLPKPLRFGSHTAYTEGWALYAEGLGRELGLFTEPMQWFGHLDEEMLRAMRLVVDTGLHLAGWRREEAIAYMQANSAMAASDIAAEVDRYIANPGQALAYKMGQLALQRLRQRAQRRLGLQFDIRRFHDQVLDTGALPLDLLEIKIEDWLLREAWPGVV